jgi:polyhydroxybutyrate depolymerase
LKFLDAMLATLHEKYSVDDRRIYAAGFSNGARHSYLLWDVRSNVFAAFLIVAGRISPSVKLTVPKPVFFSVGKEDPGYEEIMKSVNVVRVLNGMSEKGESCGEDCVSYPSSKGAPVNMYLHPHGHVYPLAMSPKFVEFFKKHTLAD